MRPEYEEISAGKLKELIDEWVIGLHAERDRRLLKRRLIDGLTYESLAEEFDLSVRQAKTIVYKRENQLFKHWPK